MIRTLIIDDEANNRQRLAEMIREHFPSIDLIGEADGVATGLKAINTLHPDLVLLDIKMADGDGFDLLQQVNPVFFKTIFITAYEEFALKAFKFSALDYLLKPVTVEDLGLALEKAEKQILSELKLQIAALNQNLRNPHNKTLVLRSSDKIHFIDTKEIIRCESDRNYTLFFVEGDKKYIVSQPLKDFEEILTDHGFFRIHKSHMVNLSFVASFDKKDGGSLILKDQSELPVARRKKEELLGIFSKI